MAAAPEQPQPQLHMLRPHLRDLPEPRLPPGYALRHFRLGEGPLWSAVYAESFGREYAPDLFDTMMLTDAAYRPERIWFVTFRDLPVATASAYQRETFMPDAGMIHYVGTRPAHAGKRLGYSVTLAALHRMVAEGWSSAWLSTDDFRLPAVRVYLDLGFRPLVTHDSHRDRWPAVFRKLGAPELAESWRNVLAGPLYVPPA